MDGFLQLGSGHLALVSHPHSFTEVGRWTVIFLYLPMLAVILFRRIKTIHRGHAGDVVLSDLRVLPFMRKNFLLIA